MLCTKILVPYDGSELAQKSLEKAIMIASSDQTIKIEVLHVVSIPVHTVLDNLQAVEDAIYQDGKEVLGKAKLALSTLPNFYQTFLLEGSPAHLILNHAKEHHCDLIIMGSRGLTGIKEFLGSVSHTVVQHAQVPVLIVK